MALSDLKKNSARSPKRALSVDEFIAGAEHYAMGLPEPIHRIDGSEDSNLTSGTADTCSGLPDMGIAGHKSQASSATAPNAKDSNAKHPHNKKPSADEPAARATPPIALQKLAPHTAKPLHAVSMKPEPMKHATFTLTAECIALLQELSQLHGTSKSALVRQLIHLASVEQTHGVSTSNDVSRENATNTRPPALPSRVVKPLATDPKHRTSDSADKS